MGKILKAFLPMVMVVGISACSIFEDCGCPGKMESVDRSQLSEMPLKPVAGDDDK